MQCVVYQCHFPAHREAEQLVSPVKTKPVLVTDTTTEINDNKNTVWRGSKAPLLPSVLQVVKGGRGWKEGKKDIFFSSIRCSWSFKSPATQALVSSPKEAHWLTIEML